VAGARYRKPKKDISTLDPNSQEYWEEILKREGLSMSRGLYPQRLKYGWRTNETPAESTEDDYSEESSP
jgi:hypothetical protein